MDNGCFKFEAIKSIEAPLSERVAEQISQFIIDQRLSEGDKLPNEFELTSQLHVGRGTIREAIKLLVSRNVLVIRRGHGTYVASNPGQVADPIGFAYCPNQLQLGLDLSEVRLQLEPWAAKIAAQRATEEDMVRLREKCQLVEDDILANRSHLEHDVELHVCIARSTQNLAVPRIIPIITYALGVFGKLTGNVLRPETIIDHRTLVDAICARNGDEAERIMRRHVELNRMKLQRLAQAGPKGLEEPLLPLET